MSIILLVAAIVAGVIAMAQVARQSASLREELEELRSRSPEAAQPTRTRADVRPLFGELYEDKPGPFDGIASWPGVPLACAAAGLFAIGMVGARPGRAQPGQADSTVAVELAAARLRYDSLASSVNELRDSVAVLNKQSRAQNSVPVRAGNQRGVKRAATTALAGPAVPKGEPGIAPLPSLPKVGQ